MKLLAVLSLKNRALIALITVVVAVFGGVALTGLKQELAPSINFPQLAVLTTYPGASPDVVNQDVSTPIETAIQGVPNIENTSATSTTGTSLISVSFTYGTDLVLSEQKINQAINRIKSTLPEGIEPQVITGSLSDFPILQIAVASNTLTPEQLADKLRASTIPDIKDVEGVRDAALLGAPKQRVIITPNNDEMAKNGLTVQNIKSTLQANGLLIPAGTITENDQTLAIQVGEKLSTTEQIAALPIVQRTAAGILTIGDIASVVVGNDPVTTLSRVNGEPALTIAVTKLPAANTVEVSQAVHDIQPELEKALGSDVTLTVVFDQAPYIEKSIESLTTEGLLGLLFAVIIILIFLLSIRSTLVTAISIPTSVLITFIGLQAADYTLNILTLGALTIAIGRVVDDSIVVIENIKRHLVTNENREKTIVRAVGEVAGAVTASTITTVAVFLPLAFVSGLTGELFRPFALTVTIALVSSLLVSLTIVPVLAYWFLRAPRAKKGKPAPVIRYDAEGLPEEKENRLQKVYRPVINWTLKHSVVTLILALLVLVGTVAAAPFMKTNFLGSSGQNTFTVTESVPAGASLDSQDLMAADVEAALIKTPGVSVVQVSIGTSGNAVRDAFFGGGDQAITFSVTTDESYDQQQVQDAARKNIGKVTSLDNITITSSSGFGASTDVKIDITAPDAKTLTEASDAVVASMRDLSSVKQVSSDLSATRPYIAVTIDRDKAAKAGYTEVALGTIVSQATRPNAVGSVVIDSTTMNMYITTDNPPATLDELKALEIPTATGQVALDTLATVEQSDGPASITTVKGNRSATVTVTPEGSDLTTTTAEVTRALDKTTLPASATAKIGGVSADQASSFGQLGIALLIAILIVYIVMVATFRSLLQPLLLLVSVPFAATGAILLQIVSGVPLGVASLIGVLMLVGIVVTNAIVLVDLINQYRRRGLSVKEAVAEGSVRRLRPILMTALATIFALLPMATGLTGTGGGFISQPLAIVVIGGLLSSTLLTLVVLPTLYSVVEGARDRRKEKRRARRSSRHSVTVETSA